MLFGRRDPASWLETFRVWLWPRRSWVRSFKYVSKRILRLTASPHAISAGVAAGVFASFTPFVGLHFIIAFVVAYIIAGNLLAAATGTFFGNPITFPFIWTFTHKLGNFILSGGAGRDGEGEFSQLADVDIFEVGFSGIWELVLGIWEPLIKPMLIGAIPLGTCFAIAAYIVTRWASVRFKEARRKRLSKKKAKAEGI